LKAGLKRIESVSGVFIVLILALSAVPVSGKDSFSASYSIGDEGRLLFYYHPESIPEQLIRNNINNGHQAEIYIKFRIQQRGSSLFMGADNLEIHVRKTGFRDQITGDYILLLDGREVNVYRDWERFFSDFSGLLTYSSGPILSKDSIPLIKAREKIIYKKLVPPFSILYLLPGKYVRQGSWNTVPLEGHR
jgi:hypothetical protein